MTRNPARRGTIPVDPCRPSGARRMATALLLPGPLGTLRLYTRRGSGRLRCVGAITSLSQLARHLAELPPPRRIVLCGRRHLADIAPAVLSGDDLHLVPLHWLAHLPRQDGHARAALAAHLVSAVQRGPIERLCAHPQLPFPF